jgi:hypothetical protein
MFFAFAFAFAFTSASAFAAFLSTHKNSLLFLLATSIIVASTSIKSTA